LLMGRFPDSISLQVAMQADEVVAGVLVFESERVRHSQYIGATEAGRDLGGLDAVFDCCIGEALQRGLRFFSFGVSTESEGEVLNDGLHTFKSEFGASGIVHEFYELPL
jgi:lipid II:glycine glycyltransferase (peptidoglycan interpeptide bridge formation enzyme)